MAANEENCIRVVAWPITQISSTGMPTCEDSLIIVSNMKVNYRRKITSSNLLAPDNNDKYLQVQEKQKHFCTLSKSDLKSGEVSPTSGSWDAVSCMITQVKSSLPCKLDKLHWQANTTNPTDGVIIALQDHEVLVRLVLDAARSTLGSDEAGQAEGSCHLQLDIKVDVFVDHDKFLSKAELIRRENQILKFAEDYVLVKNVCSPVDFETLKRDILASCKASRVVTEGIPQSNLNRLVERVLKELK